MCDRDSKLPAFPLDCVLLGGRLLQMYTYLLLARDVRLAKYNYYNNYSNGIGRTCF